jgi:hypothetical protein
MNLFRLVCVTIGFFLLGNASISPSVAIAQTLEFSAETTGILSSSDTPFWLQANRGGVYTGDGSQIAARFQVHGTDELFGPVMIHYGADFVSRAGPGSSVYFNQGYLKFRAYGLELAAGRFMHVTPGYNHRIGMGSLGVSGNSTPVPQVRLGIPDWMDLPLSGGLIEIRAHAAHGWLGSNRFTDKVLYHEKVGQARFGGDFFFNPYGGIHHFAVWGGTNHPVHGDLPVSLRDFGRIFFVQGGGEDAPVTQQTYMLGDHLGAWEMGFYLELENINLHAYRQFPLETKDNLKLKSPQDALMGFAFTFDDEFPLPVSELVYEHLYTKWQDGPRRPDPDCIDVECRDGEMGDENYYNHGHYRTGWVYNGNTIGNPLFIPGTISQGVINNRIVAHHVGISSQVKTLHLTSRITYSRNYGTWSNPFDSRRTQWSYAGGIEIPVTLFQIPSTLLAEAAYDRGQLVGNQFGMLLGLRIVR